MFSLLMRSQTFRRDLAVSVSNNYFGSNFLKASTLWASKYRESGDCCCESSGSGQSPGGGKSKHQISYTPYKAPPFQQHDLKNMTLNRPMSPHLTIYAPTNPAMTSIVERITGTIVTFYALMFACGSLFLSNGIETYVSMIQSLDLSRPLIFLIKLSLGAPFAFHYLNGIRFCLWNAGKLLSIKEVYDSANKVFIATAVLSVLFALI
ncbi:succinate dehydrogenase cytochrome b560 subunit, mitochondrial-like [Colias croceus]|uniref:succinate dehydrogenase cytochrome b560 subunit, mitochondrial-like n=1 Tax=Colias crocea TaxID=72248 RepID=UPI001E27EB14|nr:succinate dehydrogenase cytochrome b560 subunit, mitochondrial-like [Colias croceus]